MRKTESGTTIVEYELRDALFGDATLELHIDWALHPGRPASRLEPAEASELEICQIHLTGMDGLIPCPDEVHSAFVADAPAMARLLGRAEEELRDRAEMAADDAAHAALEPDF